MIAKVVVNVPSSNVDQYFDYLVPKTAESFIKVGTRVKVSFGTSNRLIMGYVLGFDETSSYQGSLKEITEVVDYEPFISDEQIRLAMAIKKDATGPLVRILNLMIPDALKLKSKKYLTIKDYSLIDARLMEFFKDNYTIFYSPKLKKYDDIIAKEVKNGHIEVSYDLDQITKEKTINKYLINQTFFNEHIHLIKNNQKLNFLKLFQSDIAKTKEEIIDEYKISLYTLNSLVNQGFLSKIPFKASRIKTRNLLLDKKLSNDKLSKDKLSFDNLTIKVLDKLDNYVKPLLFIPNTIAEQLEFILNVIKKTLQDEKKVVVFTPDILQSYQIENYIRQNLQVKTTLINSHLNSGELLDLYLESIKYHENEEVIITTAKGILFPYKNIGLYLLLDSESDNYYNDQSPRYDIHQIVNTLSSFNKAKIINVSYAPTVLEYTYGLKGYLDIIEDPNFKRSKNILIVDLKKELIKGNNKTLSEVLINNIQKTKENGLKSLLIINNKSYSSYVMCRSCGTIIKCPRCQISMQYNKKLGALLCPACSNRTMFSNQCPTCHSNELKFGGFGIQQVEEDVKELFPNLNVASLVNNNFDEYCTLESDFEDGNLDLLITTSNYAQSLYKTTSLGLIGIINIDNTAKASDYDATYRAYLMLLKASLKLNDSSKLIIQTFNPSDQYLLDFIDGDYHTFIKNEITMRKILKNEPFYYVNRIIVKGKYEEIFKVATTIKQNIQNDLGKEIYVIGPTYNYQYQGSQIIIKHKLNNISDYYQKIYETYQSTSLTVIIDKYPKYL